ncbi:MAG: PQQ-binding-like beta-propeller repeat protein [Verrucomicrobiales bacterium]
MKRFLVHSILCLLLVVPATARTWKQAASGKEIEADLIKVEDGKVHLRLPDGREGQVEILSLSLEDQEYIASLEKEQEASGTDWPAFRGPNRDGISPDENLLKSWPDDGPGKLWTYENAGMGYSGMSVVDGKLYSMGTRGDEVTVVCVNTDNGEEVWSAEIGTDDQEGYNTGWGHGPRSTPSVSEGKVYALGPKGTLACLEAETGKKVWSKHLVDDFAGKPGGWGFGESPLIDGDRLVVGPGGSESPIVALDKNTGKTIWTVSDIEVGKGKAEYATVVPTEINGTRQYLRLFSDQLVSIDAESGSVLWTADWPGEDTPAVIPTPIAEGNRIYISSGYGVGSRLIEIDENNEVDVVWENKTMKNKHGGIVKYGDYVYGSSEAGGLVCQDWETGEMVWNEKGEFFGSTDSITIADGMIYCLNDDSGTLSLVEASPEGFELHGQFKLDPQSPNRNPKGKVWVYPVVVNGKLYLRDQEYIVCHDVRSD